MGYVDVSALPGRALPETFFAGPLAPSTDTKQSAIDRVSRRVDSRIASNPNITLPLVEPVDDALLDAVYAMVGLELLMLRGFDPERGIDNGVYLRAKSAEQWVKDLAAGRATLHTVDGSGNVTGVSPPNPEGVQPDVIGNLPRNLRAVSPHIGGNGWGH
jgi:hypothetical protein